MDVLEALADPVRRRVVELLTSGERTAGSLAAALDREFGISQPAASRHLRVLREAEVVQSAVSGTQRIYTLRRDAFDDLDDWLQGIRRFWSQRLDALDTELRRMQRDEAGGDA